MKEKPPADAITIVELGVCVFGVFALLFALLGVQLYHHPGSRVLHEEVEGTMVMVAFFLGGIMLLGLFTRKK